LFGVIFGGTARGFVIYWLAIWLVGSLSMFRFARHLGADVAGAFVIAAGYSASGFYFGHAEHTAFLVSYAFLPLAAWRLDTALVDRRWIPALEAGAIWGLSGLGGYPGVLVPAGGFLVLWAVGVVLFDRRAAPSVPAGARWARGAGCVALLFFVGGLVLAPTYYGFMVEGASNTGRADPLPRELALASNALHPHGLLTFASPFLGRLEFRPLWSPTDVSSCSVYSGPFVLWLAAIGLFRRWRDPFRWWLVGWATLALCIAVGTALPIRGWLYDLVPPTRYFRHAAVFRGFAVLFVACLAALGWRELFGASRRALAISAVVLGLAASVAFGHALAVSNVAPSFLALAQFVIAWGGLVALASARPGRAKTLAAVAVLLAAADSWCSNEVVDTKESTSPELVARWSDRQETSTDMTSAGSFRSLSPEGTSNQHLKSRRSLLSAYSPILNPFHKEWLKHPVLCAAVTGPTRAWFAADAPEVPPTWGTFSAFAERSQKQGAIPIVLHTEDVSPAAVGAARRIREMPAAIEVPIRLDRYEPDHVRFGVSAPDAGWLLFTERWSSGWSATVDGAGVPLRCADYLYRAVHVERGDHVVGFDYHVAGHPALLILSWGTLVVVAVSSMAGFLRRRRAASRSDDRRRQNFPLSEPA
jgi:hypothetical protein